MCDMLCAGQRSVAIAADESIAVGGEGDRDHPDVVGAVVIENGVAKKRRNAIGPVVDESLPRTGG